VAVYPGNNQNLLSWPAVPGATSYNIFSSTASGGPYTTLATNVTGPVTGSGPANATYVDNTAINGNQYFYVVQAVNPVGTSANSTAGNATTSGGEPVTAPAAPTDVTATAGTGNVTLNWTASAGADYYTVQRATLVNSNGTQLYTTLSNTVTNTTFTDPTPTLSEEYAYIVSATNAAGTSATTTAATATVLDAAAPTSSPTTVTVVPGNGTITLNWTAVAGAFAYVIERATSPGGTNTLMGTVVGTSYVDTGDLDDQGTDTGSTLPAGTTYYYTVTAMNTAGAASAASAQVSGTTAPNAPTVAATGTTGNVTLTWGAVSGAGNYTVRRATTSGGTYSTIASNVTATTYTDTGRTNGTTYYYEVESVSSGGAVGAPSSEIGVTPMAIPTGVTISGNTGNIALTWTAVTKAGSYSVHRGTTTGGPYSISVGTVTSANLTDTTVANGTPYFYVISAANTTTDATTSLTATSTSSNSTELTATPLSAPTGVGAALNGSSVTLTWNTVTGATSYNIFRSTTSGSGYVSINSTDTSTSCSDSNLTTGDTYYYVVAAQAANSLSSNSTPVSVITIYPPGNLTATAGAGNVTLNWSAVSGASSYAVYRGIVSNGPYSLITSSDTATSFLNTGLTNGTVYYYVVAAIANGILSANSTQVSAMPLALPGNLTATAGNGNVTLAWSVAAGASNYTIQRSTTSGSGYTTLATGVTATTFKDTSAANGTTYYYVVTANNSSGSSTSAQVSATPAPPPLAPTNLTATPGNTTVALAWTASANATTYLVLRGTTSGGETTLATGITSTNFTDTGLTNGVTYYYVVSASNSAGASPDSAEVSATPAQTFAQWIAGYFPGISDPAVIGPAADPDGDGLTNLEEYLLGTNPATPDDPGTAISSATDGNGNLVLTFRLSKNLTGVTYQVQQSTDMLNWTNATVTPAILSDQGTYYLMQAPVPLASNPRLFLRLNVTGQ
jgi:fibronectin type 3 domain-containing protein